MAKKAASGAPSISATDLTQAMPPRFSRLGWTAQIFPVKPSSRVRRIATSHSPPPMKAMDLG
jgi:hypothetical protein